MALFSAAWLTGVEAVLIAITGRWPESSSAAWLLLATFACAGVGAVPVALASVALCRWRRSPLLGRARVPAGALLVAVATGLHYLNATLYVRLYLSLHLALSVAQVLLVVAGAALLLAGLGAPLRWRVGAWPGVVGATVALILGLSALVTVVRSPELRTLALGRTTLLGQSLLATRWVFGDAAAPPSLSTAPAPSAGPSHDWQLRSLSAPAGPVRGANLLLITVEAMRADRLPPNGPSVGLARIEQLVAEGTLFTRAYSASCWTVPAMAALLKSRVASWIQYRGVLVDENFNFFAAKPSPDPLVANPLAARTIPTPIQDPLPTLAQLLRGAGYQTATVPSWSIYHPRAGLTAQFEHADVGPLAAAPPEIREQEPLDLNPAAFEFLEQRDPARPFFLWLHYMHPHAPYVAQDEAARGGSPIERYSSELREVDRRLGRLLDRLRQQQALRNTLIVIHGDHGEEFGEHGGRFHATTVYEEQVRVPLVLRLPDHAALPRGQRIAQAVSLVDVTPTVLDLLGVAVDAPLFGRSLLPLLRGDPAPRRPVVTECDRWGRQQRAVIDWPFKLIVDETMRTVELYDLERDPHERQSVPDEARVARMLAMLAETRAPPGR